MGWPTPPRAAIGGAGVGERAPPGQAHPCADRRGDGAPATRSDPRPDAARVAPAGRERRRRRRRAGPRAPRSWRSPRTRRSPRSTGVDLGSEQAGNSRATGTLGDRASRATGAAAEAGASARSAPRRHAQALRPARLAPRDPGAHRLALVAGCRRRGSRRDRPRRPCGSRPRRRRARPLERVGERGGGREAPRCARGRARPRARPRSRAGPTARASSQRRDGLVEHLVQRVGLAVALEQAAAFERLPQDDAGREDVGAAIDVLGAARLLGRHVGELALELPGARGRSCSWRGRRRSR